MTIEAVQRDEFVAPLYPQNIFRLHESFLAKFAGRQPNWGPVGYAVFKRTYARDLTDEQKRQRERFGLPVDGSEEWWEVCQRSTEEVFSRQRQQLRMLGQHWDATIARRHAEEFYQRHWDGKFTGSGRMLWFLGTEALERKGSAPLFNCAAISTKFIADDFAEPFCWMMDLLMCGSGVGTDVRGAGKITIQQPKLTDEVHVVEDSREGWVKAFGILLRGYGHGEPIPKSYDLSLIRPAGTPLKSFGGRSGGPEPLRRLLREVEALLAPHVGKVITSAMIADIANMIGVCVVAGGNRRSSEIIIGDIDDKDFIGLKDDTELRDIRQRKAAREQQVLREWVQSSSEHTIKLAAKRSLEELLMGAADLPVERVAEAQKELAALNAETDAVVAADPEWNELCAEEYAHPLSTHRWASNNSILSEDDTDFEPIADARDRNGEPGNIWLKRIQTRGRMIDPPMPGNERVSLVNPCVTGDTRVMTNRGMIRISDLIGRQETIRVDLRCGSEKGVVRTTESGAFCTGSKRVVRIETVEGYSLKLTEDHRVMTSSGWIEASRLRDGMLIHISNNGGGFGEKGSKDIGMIAGWLEGDGCLVDAGVPRLYFYGDKRPLASFMSHAATRITGDETIVRASEDRNVEYFQSVGLRESMTGISKGEVPEFVWQGTQECQSAYLSALFSADGSVFGNTKKGVAIRLCSVHRQLLAQVQQLLLNFGVFSKVYENRHEAGMRMLPDGKGGLSPYPCQSVHELHIGNASLFSFRDKIGFIHPRKSEKMHALLGGFKRSPNTEKFTARFKSYVWLDSEPVYDLTEPTTSSFVANGIVVSNCGEIGLEHHELCNVPETFPSRHESLEDWKRSLKYAYILGKTISCIPTHDPKANAVMARNHRLGISVAGVAELYERLGAQETRRWLDEGYRFLRELDEEYSAWMGVGRSVRLTSVKPGGTSPLLWGVEGGMKWPTARQYFRLVRIDRGNPLLDLLRDAGYRIEPDFYAPNTEVAYFPVKLDGAIRTESEVSIWEKAEVLTMLQSYWSDNMVSVTLSFRPEETREVRRVLAMFSDRWKTCSFLPLKDAGYIQAPYTPITEAQYAAASATLKPLNFGILRGATHDQGREDRYCDGDVCEIRSQN